MITLYEQGVQSMIWGIMPPDQQPEPAPGQGANTDLPIIRDDEDLDRCLHDYLGVKLPNIRCCEGHRSPHEAFHDAFFARSFIAVWKASRGFGGKSFTLATLSLAEALFLRADVNVLGGSGVQSKRILESMGKLWAFDASPRQCLVSNPGAESQAFVWGNKAQALMASSKSVRGPHPQRLRLDEVDEIKLTLLDPALGMPMGKGAILPQVVLSSTHQYPDGTMTEVLRRAGANGWPVFEWCYKETLEQFDASGRHISGWLPQRDVDFKRSILTVAMWNTEIELQEPTSEGRAIDTERVEAAFIQVEADPADADLLTYIVELPDPEGRYGTGADWAKKKNHTVIVTIRKNVRPMRVVAIKRVQKQPWPSMAGYLDARVAAYGGTSTHDNTGIGQVVHDLLHHDSDPFNMVGRDRADLLSEYIAALEKGDLVWPRDDRNPALQAAYSEHKYATRDDVYKGSKDGTGSHHLPDTISAGALAWRAASQAEPASAMSDEDPNSVLGQDLQRGRLRDYINGGLGGRPSGLGRRRPGE